jgi:hypothetical protein
MAAVFRDHGAATGAPVPHDAERLRCYQDYFGPRALRIFAEAGNEEAYRWTRARLLAV